MIRSGVLSSCQCNNPNCSVYFFKPYEAAQELERLRRGMCSPRFVTHIPRLGHRHGKRPRTPAKWDSLFLPRALE
jgi:hypothetical protein